MAKKRPSRYGKKYVGMKYGFRSGLEKKLEETLTKLNIPFKYEEQKIEYIQPEQKRTYTPDFIVPKKDGSLMYIETKGRWVTEDRKKMEMIFEQYPYLDIRFVFGNSNGKIRKGSKTTYSNICDKHGWKWSDKSIPIEWLEEIDTSKEAKNVIESIEQTISNING